MNIRLELEKTFVEIESKLIHSQSTDITAKLLIAKTNVLIALQKYESNSAFVKGI